MLHNAIETRPDELGIPTRKRVNQPDDGVGELLDDSVG
jgi:hypothetical protein